jgi:hypothetical protein
MSGCGGGNCVVDNGYNHQKNIMSVAAAWAGARMRRTWRGLQEKQRGSGGGKASASPPPPGSIKITPC